jgi:hypothetical protein
MRLQNSTQLDHSVSIIVTLFLRIGPNMFSQFSRSRAEPGLTITGSSSLASLALLLMLVLGLKSERTTPCHGS